MRSGALRLRVTVPLPPSSTSGSLVGVVTALLLLGTLARAGAQALRSGAQHARREPCVDEALLVPPVLCICLPALPGCDEQRRQRRRRRTPVRRALPAPRWWHPTVAQHPEPQRPDAQHDQQHERHEHAGHRGRGGRCGHCGPVPWSGSGSTSGRSARREAARPSSGSTRRSSTAQTSSACSPAPPALLRLAGAVLVVRRSSSEGSMPY